MNQVEHQDQAADEVEALLAGPLPVDPGHVRTLAHYKAMLVEASAEPETEQQ